MNLRERQYEREKWILSPYACFSENAQNSRERIEKPCDMRTDFQRDRDRILHSKAFRRLKHKTQVFIAPEGDHYRTRLTHTLEVAQIARTIARALALNEDLTEAIALGHDLGHTPFGHAGERALADACREILPEEEITFEHNEQSVRIVEYLENNYQGLNLTKEVRDGILNHPSRYMPATLEGKVVRLSDKIAYINHDIDDALRGKIICENDLPSNLTRILGTNTKERLDTLVHDVVNNSLNQPDVYMSPDIDRAMTELRIYMFENVYVGSRAKNEEFKAKRMLRTLFEHFIVNWQELPEEYTRQVLKQDSPKRVVLDYISGMTDQYAIRKFEEIFVPGVWKE
ncbi:deoxyguanosinetriphosphate triphosphohydrolase [Clostridiales bacterium COT073_COT-073]|nr:deoxyguanosinetriphosphate triphosphohydrolase [Clostridiales bacterium COT073_COT-073]